MMLNVSADGGQGRITQKQRRRKLRQLLWLPLFVSFFEHQHGHASDQARYSKYNKADPKRQGQVFEKITGKTNADNICGKATDHFGGKFPSVFIKKVSHEMLLLSIRGRKGLGGGKPV